MGDFTELYDTSPSDVVKNDIEEVRMTLDNYLTESVVSLGNLRDALRKCGMNKAADRIGRIYDTVAECNDEYEEVRKALIEII